MLGGRTTQTQEGQDYLYEALSCIRSPSVSFCFRPPCGNHYNNEASPCQHPKPSRACSSCACSSQACSLISCECTDSRVYGLASVRGVWEARRRLRRRLASQTLDFQYELYFLLASGAYQLCCVSTLSRIFFYTRFVYEFITFTKLPPASTLPSRGRAALSRATRRRAP